MYVTFTSCYIGGQLFEKLLAQKKQSKEKQMELFNKQCTAEVCFVVGEEEGREAIGLLLYLILYCCATHFLA